MLLLFAFSLISCAFASRVVELGDDDFKSRLEDMDLALVKFYAPWCGHCKKMAPEFDKASESLYDDNVRLVKVDCTGDGKSTCGEYSVSGYPTVKIFRKGEFTEDYNGPRDAAGITKFMRKKSGPSSKLLESLDVAEKMLGQVEPVVFGFFENEDAELQKVFKQAADALSESHKFAHTFSADLSEKYGFQNQVVIFQPSIFHNKFEDAKFVYSGNSKLSELKNWIPHQIHGIAGHRTESNADQFKKPLVVAYYDVDYVRNVKGTNYWRNRVMKVAKKLKDDGKQVFFAVSNKEEFGREMQEFGLSMDGDSPKVAITDSKNQKFAMSDEFSMDNLEKFVNDFLDGKLEPYLKSEPVPASNDEPVKVVVAKNFDEIVNDETKDVLIEFYAPWCGHCKNLAPVYDEVAAHLKGEDDIVIAKMDATANDVPAPYQVSGFPTLYFAPKNGKKNPKKYQGGREKEDFVKYLAKESTDELKGFTRNGKTKKVDL